jgi:hypothetical protein
MLKGVVAEVQVWSMTFHSGDDRMLCYAEQVNCNIGAGAGSVSFFQLPCDVFADLHRSSNNDNTLHSNCQRKSQRPRIQSDLLFPDKHPDLYKPLYE